MPGAREGELPPAEIVAEYVNGGRHLIGAYAPVTPWGLGAVVDKTVDDALRPVDRIRWATLFWMGVSVVVGSLAACVFARRLSDRVGGAGRRLEADRRRQPGDPHRAGRPRRARPTWRRRSTRWPSALDAARKKITQQTNEIMAWNQTLEKRVEEKTAELRQAQDLLLRSRSLSALGELGAGVAHEINNPLTGALGIVQLLLADLPGGHPALPLLQDLEREALRIRKIVQNMLRLAQRQSGTDTTPVDLARVARRRDRAVRPERAVRRRHRGDPQVRAGAAGARAARPSCEEAFIQLIQNARVAMLGQRGGKLTLEIKAIENKLVRVTVADTGAGISAENLPRIFDPFFTTKASDRSGSGLGLSFVHRIVEDNGGTIQVESTPGSGHEVRADVPRRRRDGRTGHDAARAPTSRTVAVALIAIGDRASCATRVSRRLFESARAAAAGRRPQAAAAGARRAAAGRRGRARLRGHVGDRQGRGAARATAGRRSSRATSSRASDVVRTVRGVRRRAAPGGRDGDRAARRRRDPPGRVERGRSPRRRRRRGRRRPRPAAAGARAAPASICGAARCSRASAAPARCRSTRATPRTTSEGPARFVVLADEHGRVAVATIAGTARFAAGGKSVIAAGGHGVRAARRGAPPDDPEHISEEVFLNVVWPTRRSSRRARRDQGPRDAVVGRDRARAERPRDRRRRRRRTVLGHRAAVGVGKTPIEVEAEDLVGHTQAGDDDADAPPAPAAGADAGGDRPVEEAGRPVTSDEPPAPPPPDGAARSAETVARLRDLLAAAGRLAEFGRFAAQQIHELRQPLFAIKGLAQLLLEKDRVELDEVLDFARHIVEQSERLTALVSNLRLLSVPAHARRRTRRSEIGAVLVRVTSLLEFRLRKAGATLRTQIAPDLPPLVVVAARAGADPDQPAGERARRGRRRRAPGRPGARPRARRESALRRSSRSPTTARASPRRSAHRLFESFFTTKGEEQGTGLGLAVSREIARSVGRRSRRCSTSPGRWSEPAVTVFRLTLPVSQEL